MDLLFCLRDILSDFRHLFNVQNFMLFQAFIFGFIANRGDGTLTELYRASGSETRYWSFPKFLSRGKWSADAVAVPSPQTHPKLAFRSGSMFMMKPKH